MSNRMGKSYKERSSLSGLYCLYADGWLPSGAQVVLEREGEHMAVVEGQRKKGRADEGWRAVIGVMEKVERPFQA